MCVRHGPSCISPSIRDPTEDAIAGIRLEDVRRAVDRLMIRRDHEVDARVQVVGDLVIDDVCFVANDERLDELHGAQSLRAPFGEDDPSMYLVEPALEADHLGLREHR